MDPRIASYLSEPLALRPQSLSTVASLAPRAEGFGGFMPDAEPFTRVGGMAVLTVSGPMCFGGGVFAWLFGMSDTERLCEGLHAAAEDGTVDTVLLDIDSPGGDVAGMADLVAACDAVKASGTRLVAVVHDAAYSAAYWLASQADELCLTETACVGSIGVFAVLYDESAAFAEMGIRPILIASTPLKGVNVPGVGITDPQIAAEGEPIARLHQSFVNAVANGRGVDPSVVQGWAESADAVGADAVSRGMADRVVTFRGLLDELANPGVTPMTQTKSAAALKRAAETAPAPKAEDKPADQMTPEQELEMVKSERDQLQQQCAELQAQLDAMAETDTGEEDAPEDAPAAAAFADYKSAFAAAGQDLTDQARAYITEAMEDGIDPKAAAKSWGKIVARGAAAPPVSPAVAKAAESTDPVAGGPARDAGPARVRWNQQIASARAQGMTTAAATEHVIKTNPGLREEMLSEVNGR